MEIYCTICSDIYTQSSEVVLNHCGHLFHRSCLIQWLLRSTTCPQCRCKCSGKTIFKVFLNFVDSEHSRSCADKQQCLDVLKVEMTKLNKRVTDLETKTKEDIEAYQSTIHHLKEELCLYKSEPARSALKYSETVKAVIQGTSSKATEILQHEKDRGTLALLAISLKRSLIAQERKADLLQNMLKHLQKQSMKYKKDYIKMASRNNDIRKKLEVSKQNWEFFKRDFKELWDSLDVIDINDIFEKLYNNPNEKSIRSHPGQAERSRTKKKSTTAEISSADEITPSQLKDGTFYYRNQVRRTKPSFGVPAKSLKNLSILKLQSTASAVTSGPSSSSSVEESCSNRKSSRKVLKRTKSPLSIPAAKLRKSARRPHIAISTN